MRPPICALCDRDALDQGGGLVAFAMTRSDQEWAERAEAEGFVGHPPWQEWFCGVHAPAARQLVHLPLGEALAALMHEGAL